MNRREMLDILAETASIVEAELDFRLPPVCRPAGATPSRLNEAVRYAVFSGGKRLRPALCVSAAKACGGNIEDVLPAACALEMIHAYSLIHDDLPAMDDDDLRRGRPAVHVAFDEATAILAGDALLTEAFGVIADTPRIEVVPEMVRTLSEKAGLGGMVAGQQLDIEAEGLEAPGIEVVREIHAGKTAALLEASVVIGALSAGAPEHLKRALSQYGYNFGMAYQVADDCLDATGTSEQIGKTPGRDAARKKAGILAVMDLDSARAEAERFAGEAIAALGNFGPEADFLRAAARYAVSRSH